MLTMKIPKLTYNAAAYYAGEEKYPDGLIDALLEEGRAGFDALCWALSELSAQTELIRRFHEEGERPMLPPEYFALCLTTPDALAAKKVVIDAISEGLKADEDQSAVNKGSVDNG